MIPYWDGSTFVDGSGDIRAAFERLVTSYGVPAADSPAVDAADPAQAPLDDILGTRLGLSPDVGAYETNPPWAVFLPILVSSP